MGADRQGASDGADASVPDTGVGDETPDEAFIRAIVAAPGDDTPRLAHAEWLDERGDPRGAWLRAELAWAGPWRTGRRPAEPVELQAQAREHDAGWIARVARPPLGVCCDHLELRRGGSRLRGGDVDRGASKLGVRFPEQLRAFLLNYNGGRGRVNGCPHPRIAGIDSELQRWFSLAPDEQPPSTRNLMRRIADYRAGPPAFRSLIPLVAADAGYYEAFAIGHGAKNFGRVYHVLDFHLHEPPLKAILVARTLGEFLASILVEVPLSVYPEDDE